MFSDQLVQLFASKIKHTGKSKLCKVLHSFLECLQNLCRKSQACIVVRVQVKYNNSTKIVQRLMQTRTNMVQRLRNE